MSTCGRVIGKSGKELAPWLNQYGYRQITAHVGGKRWLLTLSRMVLMAHRGPPPSSRHQAEHLDGNRENNTLPNLAWATPLENIRRKHEHGTTARGTRNGNAKTTEHQARSVKRMPAEGSGTAEVVAELGVTPDVVRRIRQGRTWAWL